MNILVYGVAATSGGALSVLKECYRKFEQQKDNHYIFIVSTPQLPDTKNITVLRYPNIKKSWFHRLWFEYLEAPNLVRKYGIEEIFSLTNTTIPRTDVRQILYLHQPLPFISQRFKLSENLLFWVYQNVIGKLIIYSVRRADKVIVQTEWIRDSAAKICNVSLDKFTIQVPSVDTSLIVPYRGQKTEVTFFFPAAPLSYKNHSLIIKACQVLKKKHICNYKVLFTLTGRENKYAVSLKRSVENHALPIYFIGMLSHKQVFEMYGQSILVFPSYIETFGLPLLEAKLSNAPILASNMPFCREVLNGYESCKFYDKDDFVALSNYMEECITKHGNFE
ncbi:glycosyltransferase [Dialister sp.]|jgi:glycosyltransferase involved in cell wall biosynthesis|uniref:glycosyltransferase n=1 Tax=Dialister sp. TaxID=1955814 RepID=UPI003A5BC4EC